jgi:hypothetical protein
MALPIFATPQFTIMKPRFISLATLNYNFRRPTKCKATYEVANDHSQTIHRRSSKFQPSIWTDDYIQSLNSEYKVQLSTIVVC